jgi:uncharacterized protein YxjI
MTWSEVLKKILKLKTKVTFILDKLWKKDHSGQIVYQVISLRSWDQN